ncbi:MAG: phosphomannomutase, partial [Patescibacteria group bacterium]
FIKASLNYIADLKIPQKRGTFFEFRTGVINICPVGRNCSQEERDAFEQYDNEHNIRKNMITHLKEKFPNNNLHYSIGGQISFDVFPKGWDKTFCLNHLQLDDYQEIHFIGDKTHQGGNDHEIYEDKRTIGHRTNNPEETIQIIEQILK